MSYLNHLMDTISRHQMSQEDAIVYLCAERIEKEGQLIRCGYDLVAMLNYKTIYPQTTIRADHWDLYKSYELLNYMIEGLTSGFVSRITGFAGHPFDGLDEELRRSEQQLKSFFNM
ncbi:hypothetical protein QNI16_12460 [Cytophagaceae bacterium YF14B1]|uniref:Uncharacterized protein n=1 Tax=Xanthocytophaga flava TaxID=3048013 RepID=A0AAE3QQJ8_9BACT|nr:hypothetical protein [Xanthocytophaga flavus]MDJ1481301.1 hypothetical protein [Xanthocytophaga flavus]